MTELPEGRKPITTMESADLVLRMHDKLTAGFAAGDRIAQLEAENKLLNEQLDAIEEMGTESLNALPDCLMRLAPALVENDELKAKLEMAVDAFTRIDDLTCHNMPMTARDEQAVNREARATLTALKGQDDG